MIVLYIKTQGEGISVYNRQKRWSSCNVQLNSFKSLPPMCEAGRSCTWQIAALGVQVTASLEGRGVRLLETELRYAACRKSVPSRYLLRGGAAHYSVAFERKWMRRAWKCALCVTHTHTHTLSVGNCVSSVRIMSEDVSVKDGVSLSELGRIHVEMHLNVCAVCIWAAFQPSLHAGTK